MPPGQTIGLVHVPAPMQVTVQVPAGSHVPMPASAQISGHTAAASTMFASPASASAFVAPSGRGPSPAFGPSLLTRASAPFALPSSEANVTSGKEHAAAAKALANAIAIAIAMRGLLFTWVSSRPHVNEPSPDRSKNPARATLHKGGET